MKKFFIFLFLLTNVFTNFPSTPSHLAVTRGVSSSFVEGCVNVITGDYYISQNDILVKGKEPIKISRVYLSKNNETKNCGWNFFPYMTAILNLKTYTCFAPEKDGSILAYKIPKRKYKYKKHTHWFNSKKTKKKIKKKNEEAKVHNNTNYVFELKEESYEAGITNASHLEISGKINVKNNYVVANGKLNSFTIAAPDGSWRRYSKVAEKKSKNAQKFGEYKNIPSQYYTCLIREECLANGNYILYEYDEYDRLKKITTTNCHKNKTYAWVIFHYFGKNTKDGNFSLETSDGKLLEYIYERYQKTKKTRLFYLTKISHTNNPNETLKYYQDKDVGNIITKREFPNGRGMQIEYYNKNCHHVRGEKIVINRTNNRRFKRVKKLLLPTGKNGSFQSAYEFIYHPGKIKEKGGYTEVYDAKGNKITYSYDKNLRLTKIEKFIQKDGKYVLKNFEKLIWGKNGSEKATFLLGKGIFNSQNKAILFIRYFYDDKGNIIKERLYGNLTGEKEIVISFNKKKLPIDKKVEFFEIRRTYTNDYSNKILSQETTNGTREEFSYWGQTDLLYSKITKYNNKIILRNFYVYNHDNVLIKEIIDDGNSYDRNNLSGVTKRTIKNIHLINNGPFINMPKEIEEKYLDLKTNREKLLNKRILHRSKYGLIIQEDFFDANNQYCYSIFRKFSCKDKLIKQTNPIGQSQIFKYDKNNNQIFFQDYHGKIKKYINYDCCNRETQIIEQGNNIKHITFLKYDRVSNLIEKKDFLGNVTKYKYDEFKNLKKIISPKTQNNIINSYCYDDIGRKIKEIDPNGNSITIKYNSHNKPIKKIFPDNTKETFTYNLDGSLKTQIDRKGIKTIYTYDGFKREICRKIKNKYNTLLEEHKKYTTFNLISEIDAEGNETKFFYDCAGRKILETFNKKKEKEFFYDSLSRLKKIRMECSQNSYFILYKKDNLDRILEERKEDLNGKILFLQNYDYDSFGNKKRTYKYINGKKVFEQFIYDSFNRPTKIIDASGYETITEFDENHINNLGQRVIKQTITYPNGLQEIIILDAIQRKVSLKKLKYKIRLKHDQFFYDANSNLIKQTYKIFKNNNHINTIKILKKYDSMNRLIELNEEGKKTCYRYTKRDLLSHIIKPDKTILINTYDDLGKKISLKSSDNKINYFYIYDKLGQLVEAKNINDNTSTIIFRDKKGNILKETLENGLVLENKYDNLNRKIKTIFPDQSSVDYEFDSINLKKITRKNVNQEIYSYQFEKYDLSQNCLKEKMINNLGTIQNSFDSINRKIKFYSPYFYQEIKKFDSVGNVITSDYNGKISNYEYDELSQITKEEGNFTNNYAFDTNNNMLQKNEKQFTINKLNQITSTQNRKFSYDKNGNLIFIKSKNNYTHYTYDALDRLISIETKYKKFIYTYDALNRRISKTYYKNIINLGFIKQYHHLFLYDDKKEIGIYNTQKKAEAIRILDNLKISERNSAIAIELNQKVYAPIHDLYGNVIALISNNQIQEQYHYSAFGEEIIYKNSSKNPWRYLSKYTEENGLVFFGRRYYDPKSFRWINCDPKGFEDGMNLYAFILNNPLINSDPFGLSVENEKNNSGFIQQLKEFVEQKDLSIIEKAMYYTKDIVGNALKFYSMNFFTDKSRIINLRTDPDPLLLTVFTNGVNNTEAYAKESCENVMASLDLTRVNIDLFYNHSKGSIADLKECLFDKSEISSKISRQLIPHITNFLDKDPSRRCLIICHSQGATKVENALKFLPERHKLKVYVIAIAPATIIRRKELGISCINYLSKRDFVPFFSSGAWKSLQGNLPEVVFLNPHKNAKLLDHSFRSPTYAKHLNDEINEFFKNTRSLNGGN